MVHIAPDVAQIGIGLHAGLHGVTIHSRAGVGVQGLPQVGAHTQPVRSRVEVHTKGRAFEGDGRGRRAHGRQHATAQVQRIQAPCLRQSVKHTLGHTEVDAHQLVARRQALHRLALQEVVWPSGIEGDQLIGGCDGHHLLAQSTAIGHRLGAPPRQRRRRDQGSTPSQTRGLD